jgi:hypothetical protein
MAKPGAMNPATGWAGTATRGMDCFAIQVVLGVSGAITVASTDTVAQCRIGIIKTAAKTGRYTLTLPDRYRKFCGGFVTILGPTDVAIGANTTGLDYYFRNNNLAAAAGTIDLQFFQASYADAEVADNTTFIVTLFAARGI